MLRHTLCVIGALANMARERTALNPVLRALAAGPLRLVVVCTRLPSIAPRVAGAPKAPVPVEGAGGALTPQQCKAVLGRLAAFAPDTQIFEVPSA